MTNKFIALLGIVAAALVACRVSAFAVAVIEPRAVDDPVLSHRPLPWLPLIVFEEPTRLSWNAGERDQFEPAMASDGSGKLYALWKDGTSGSSYVRFAYSHDFGETWTDDVRVSDPIFAFQTDPAIWAMPDGHVYLEWLGFSEGRKASGVMLSVSDNEGRTFRQPPRRQSTRGGNSPANFVDRQWMLVDKNTVYTTYHVRDSMYVNVGLQNGQKVRAAVRLNPDGLDSAISATLTRTPDGAIHAVWLGLADGNPTVRHARSTDGAKTWSEPKKIADVFPLDYTGRADAYPVVASDSEGRIFVAWPEGFGRYGAEDNRGHIVLTRSTDGGKTWSDPAEVNDDRDGPPDASYKIQPWLDIDSSDRIHVAWNDYREGEWSIQYAASVDHGHTFSINIPVSDQRFNLDDNNKGDFMGLTVDDTYVYCVYSLPQDGRYNIYFARAANALPDLETSP